MNKDSEVEIGIRRITLADGRYLIFYTFARKQPEYAGKKLKGTETENKSSPESDLETRV